MKVQHVPTELVQQVWPHVEQFLKRAADVSSDYTVSEIRTMVAMGNWKLLVVVDDQGKIHGAIIVDFFNRPRDRVAFITYVGGRGIANQNAYTQLCAQLKAFGATTIEGCVHSGVARLWRRFGLKAKYTIVGVTL